MTPFEALRTAITAYGDISEIQTSVVIERLATLGFHVVSDEEIAQLRESYHKMLQKYYQADDDLTTMRRNLRWILSNHQIPEMPDEEVASGDTSCVE